MKEGASTVKTSIFILIYLLSSAAFAGLTQDKRKELFQGASQRLKDAKLESKVLKVGDTFPDLRFEGKTVSEHLKDGPLVLTFYRGGWCPYCMKQLKDINSSLQKIKHSGASLIALSPERASEVRKTKRKNSINFPLISDEGNIISRQLNLTFKVEPDVVREYKALGIDLAASQGNDSYELPMPATFVIDKNRKVAYVFADADYTKRASTEEIINVVKKISN